jgi:hypothetical protein
MFFCLRLDRIQLFSLRKKGMYSLSHVAGSKSLICNLVLSPLGYKLIRLAVYTGKSIGTALVGNKNVYLGNTLPCDHWFHILAVSQGPYSLNYLIEHLSY